MDFSAHSRMSASVTEAPASRTMAATTSSPDEDEGMPTMATSRTPGIVRTASSTWEG